LAIIEGTGSSYIDTNDGVMRRLVVHDSPPRRRRDDRDERRRGDRNRPASPTEL
jgi:hypothetical protein